MLGDGGGQGLAAVDGRDVLRYGNTVGPQLFGDGLADVRFAARDIHFGTLSNETGGDHLADAPGAAGDQRGAPSQRKERLGIHEQNPV